MKPWIKRAIPIVFYVLLTVFLVVYLTTIDWATIASIRFDWLWVVVATVVSLAYRYWMVLIWLVILRSLGAGRFADVPKLVLVYARSWLGRYIPGTAPWILGKIFFASQQGLSTTKLAVSSFLEGGLQVLVLLVTGLVVLLIDLRTVTLIDPWLIVLMVAAALAGIVALWPRVFNAVARLAYRVIRKRELSDEDLPGWGTIGRGAGLYVIGALLSGLSMFFIAKAVWPDLGWETLLFVVGATNLAGAIGMIAVFAPSGIGVREAITVLLLGIVMPTEIALVAAIVLRLWSILVDLLFLVLAQTHVSLRRRPPEIPSQGD